jgi:hypothetical protein
MWPYTANNDWSVDIDLSSPVACGVTYSFSFNDSTENRGEASLDKDDDGTLAGLPWASVFDPAANVRALGEIQKRGLRAAGDVVDRLVRSVDGEHTPTDQPTESNPGTDPRPEFDQLMSSWAMFLQRLTESLIGRAPGGNGVATGEAVIDLASGESSGAVELRGSRSEEVSVEVWLHNRTTEEADGVRLRCSDLLTHDGACIPSEVVRFDPAEVPSMPARSSRGIDVIAEIPPSAANGVYRGTLLAQGHPDLWLPVSLAVTGVAR